MKASLQYPSFKDWPHLGGAQPEGKGFRFTLFAPDAETLSLLLFKSAEDAEPSRTVKLKADTHRVGDLWSVLVKTAKPGMLYAWAVSDEQWIVDPWARHICAHPSWGELPDFPAGTAMTRGKWFPKALLREPETFDWGKDTRPAVKPEDRMIYEVHLRGFTRDESSGVKHPGTFAGFIQKIPYLVQLGITTVELLPIMEFNEVEFKTKPGEKRAGLLNYWGYSTRSFFAPQSRFGSDDDPINGLKKLVKALHAAGLEVIMDVVFNHTAESGSTWHWTALARKDFYYVDNKTDEFIDFTGCGHTVQCNREPARSFIVDCLRYWVSEFHIDGFRFDLAAIFTRGDDGGRQPDASIMRALEQDPVLKGTQLIAEPWDTQGQAWARNSHVKTIFGTREKWQEWNDFYRDDFRKFWRGDSGFLRPIVNRLIGSPDRFSGPDACPQKGINFITCHDGFTMHDLVRYTTKRNEANGEDNEDGTSDNINVNFGVEGESDDPEVSRLRLRRQKNFLASLFLSQGTPMLLAGDEFSRTQGGNNNGYCQDNDVSWVNWNLLDKNDELYGFTKMLIRFRREHQALRVPHFLNDKGHKGKLPQVEWSGQHDQAIHWDHGHTIGCLLNADSLGGPEKGYQHHVFMAFNSHNHEVKVTLPHAKNRDWQFAFSTARRAFTGKDPVVTIPEQCVAVWTATCS